MVLASAIFSMKDGVTPFIPNTFVAFVVLIIFFGAWELLFIILIAANIYFGKL